MKKATRNFKDGVRRRPSKHLLPWKNRVRIAIDVANALEYLHFYCDPPLYHGDVKPSNVFLDKNYLAKLAGCGLVHYSSSGNTTPSCTLVNVKIQATPDEGTSILNVVLTSASDC
ncbi:unnamed protein product [Miscanthus lutarioriparius]|uniref:Protein kinase domain-containing protein n=1 Tax=Miscanthus lutarioriparius TaxID=422564 RepID=A0A811S2G6_9POAL|nr:unnamed protein product [Miscanthus lutarioriparius]